MTGYVWSPIPTRCSEKGEVLQKLEEFPLQQKVMINGEIPDHITKPETNTNKTVYILVSGYLCPLSKWINELYWGEALNRKDVFVSRLPWCGTHEDRACELYAQIKGIQTIYFHLNGKKGRDFTGKGLYPQWSSDLPIVLIGHSIGGCTVYSLQKLLVELSNKKELDHNGPEVPFRMIRGIVTVASPLKGCFVPYPFGFEETEDDVIIRYGSITYYLMMSVHFLQLFVSPVFDYIFNTDDMILGLKHVYDEHPFNLMEYYQGTDKVIETGINVVFEMSLNRCIRTERTINELVLDSPNSEYTWYLSFCCRHEQFNKNLYSWSYVFDCVKRDVVEASQDTIYWNNILSRWAYSLLIGFKTYFMFGLSYLIQDDQYFDSLKRQHRRVNREFGPNVPAIDGEMHLNYQHYSHPRITVVEVRDTDHSSIIPLPINKMTQLNWFDNLYNLFSKPSKSDL